ncbi:rifin PIR protein, putative [Plasmodium reichenowi]|uniref:Rifin PIR protein, putative n=1 Tax=Plasmodium reichenowi TaxID=5854 RepID=A0A2P9DSA5_PLARE|nr:rifin PIR protein, putative [Plasmodium reichenowi]
MKVHYFKILLFFLTLNILLTLYHENTHKKPYVTTPHTRTTISRVLSECNKQSSIYDKDAEMKSVKENFDRRTSQRFEEYEERMKEKRQKRKEERDKNIQEIIEKDRMDKSLAEKVEKCCLRCGCVLGGGVLPIWGLVSGIWYAILSQYVTKTAIQKGIEKGIEVGLVKVRDIAKLSLEVMGGTIPEIDVLETLIAGKFTDGITLYDIFQCINSNISGHLEAKKHGLFVQTVKTLVEKGPIEFNSENETSVTAVEKAFEEGNAAEFAAKTGLLSNTIIASVVAIVVIVLVLIIIYLVLRYRRKKKMKKKDQYTKLLSQ